MAAGLIGGTQPQVPVSHSPCLAQPMSRTAGTSVTHFGIGADVLLFDFWCGGRSIAGSSGPSAWSPSFQSSTCTLHTSSPFARLGGLTAAFSCRLSHTISAKADAAGSGALYGKLMTLTVVAWVAYPVVWAIGEGAGVIDETIEVLL